MSASIWVGEIEFNDNSKVQFSKNDIVVFVGPNNAGKSASLKEVSMLLRQKDGTNIVIKSLSLEREGDIKDIASFLEGISVKNFSKHGEAHFRGLGFNVLESSIEPLWNNYKNGLAALFSAFVNMLGTEERLKAANPSENIRLIAEPPTHPIQFLQKNDQLEKRFSDYFKQAFGADLIIHRNAGREVPLYVGQRPALDKDEDRLSHSYINKIEKLDLLHQQGDGMRSFVGLLLNAFVSSYTVIFIDEPEAFLHPPQARLLGKMLARDLPSERQLFLATHSEDFLKGLLDADSNNLKIVRIQREGKVNKVSVLDNSDIKDIWSDPILRHSNVLNGLFHSKVIICESDSDCRFYSALISSAYESSDSISPDLLFIHCGGKHRLATVVKSLMKLNVHVRVIADFDLLNEESPLENIYAELGGDWNEIKTDWQLVKMSIDHKRPELETKELKQAISDVLSSVDEKIFPKLKIADIQKLLKKASPWAHAKELGATFIPSGDATKAYERIQTKLIQNGLYIVDVGELESFDKSVGNHGPKWVNEVLKKDLKSDPHLEIARQFIQKVVS